MRATSQAALVVALSTFAGLLGCAKSPPDAPPEKTRDAPRPPIEAPKDDAEKEAPMHDDDDNDAELPSAAAKIAITYDHEAVERQQQEALQVLKNAERANGGLPMIKAGGMPLKFDVPTPPADAITATSRCSEWVMGCFGHEAKKRGLKGPEAMAILADCVRAAPRCQSAEPWKEARACCAEKCVALFEEGLAAGMTPIDAWTDAITKKHCMPGVAELMKSFKD